MIPWKGIRKLAAVLAAKPDKQSKSALADG